MNRRPHTKTPDQLPAQAGLVDCIQCGSDFVVPTDWEPTLDARWWIALRCGQCGISREVNVTNDEAERFDAALDERMDVITGTLHRLDLERMAEEVETVLAALDRDLIDAGDFAV